MNIAETLEKTAPFSFEYKGETVSGNIREEAVMSPDFIEGMGAFKDKPTEMARVFSDVITDWDIDMNGEPYLPTFENLRRLPFPFFEAMIEEITESFLGKPQTSPASGNGSGRTAKRPK